MAHQDEKRMMAAACRYAYSRFVLNYDLFYETAFSEGEKASEKLMRFREKFQGICGRFLGREPFLEELSRLREGLLQEMEILTAYVDYFEVFEYVINRLEKRFSDEKPLLVNEEELVDEIMGYLVTGQDTAWQSEQIRAILGQLPIRFTKAKFFSILSHALSIYEGTGRESLRQVVDMLRREALLSIPEDMAEGHKTLQDLLIPFQKADFKTLSREEFQNLQNGLSLAQEILYSETSDGMMMVDLVNDLYVIGLTRGETLMDSQEEGLYRTILTKVHCSVMGEEEVSEEEMGQLWKQMEGRQERYYQQWSRYEMKDLELDLNIQKDSPYYDSLRKAELLLSTSSFMSLEEEQEPAEEILLSRKAVEEMCDQLSGDLEKAWKTMPKQVVHALMARLLSRLPMFFTHSDELREFIGGCLSSCTDVAELASSAELIREIMESDNALV